MAKQGPEHTRKILINMARGLETGRSLAYQYDYSSDRMEDNPEFIDADDPKMAAKAPYSRNILLSSEERLSSSDKTAPKADKYKRNPIRVVDGKENNKDNINKVLIADVIIPEDDPNHDKPVYIAWTGSDNTEKWVADFVEGYPGAASYRRHEKEMMTQIKAKLLEHYRKNPDKPLKLIFTGHSLGGALAQRNFNSFQKELLKDLAAGEAKWVSHMGCTVFNSAGVSKTVADSSNKCSKALVERGIEQELTYVANRGDIVTQTGFAILNDPENNKAQVHSVFKELLKQSSVAMKAAGPGSGIIAGAVLGTTFGGPLGGIVGAFLGGTTLTGAVALQQLNAHTLNEAEKLEILSTTNPNEAKKVKEILDWKSSFINRAMGNMTYSPDFPTLAQSDHFHGDALQEQFEVVERKLLGKWSSYTCAPNADGDNLFHIIAKNNRLDLWQACEEFKTAALVDLVRFDKKNKSGKTPIHLAIENGHVQLAAKMLAAYPGNTVQLMADILRWKKNLQKINDIKAALPVDKQSAFENMVKEAQALIELQSKASSEFSAIVKSKDPKQVEKFLVANSGYLASAWHTLTSSPDHNGNTPLHALGKMEDQAAAVAIIDAIANTQIRKSASLKYYTADELVNLGAKNKNGKTPLDKAIRKGHFETAKAMVKLYPNKEQQVLLTLIEDKMKRKTISTSYDALKASRPADVGIADQAIKKEMERPKK